MNKDLEIIKKNLDYFMLSRTDKYGRECAKNIINLAASRMAVEIAAQSKVNYAAHELLKDKNSEIARLKAELARLEEEKTLLIKFEEWEDRDGNKN